LFARPGVRFQVSLSVHDGGQVELYTAPA